jgi:hydroxymethyl cephem carbamoyltransferase
MTIANSRNRLGILGIKPGHDGAVAFILDGELKFSFESEKDNGYRYAEVDLKTFVKALSACETVPDVIASGGWSAGASPDGDPVGAGYRGLNRGVASPTTLMGTAVNSFTSSHERSHILCAYGLSPFKQGEPCYALVWEGHIGSLYFVDEHVTIKKLVDVLMDPGVRYAFLYALADPAFQMGPGAIRLSDAGKLMAIAGYASGAPVCEDGQAIVDRILSPNTDAGNLNKEDFRSSKFYNCGVTDPYFAGVARLLSDQLYEVYETAASTVVQRKLPLLISGGCGLNCEWNSRWIGCGLFSDVFIPPCANDSGSAIGTAIDAMLHYTGNAKLKWSVYAGERPIEDIGLCPGFIARPYDAKQVALFLKDDKVLGWMRGKYEMGPRALGGGSILASPASAGMLQRLNDIKRREGFRPIAPICLVEDMAKYFNPPAPSPYMLEFRQVISKAIPAVTHVDQSARPQSVSLDQNCDLYELLTQFRKVTGLSVLCNTSLNFNGFGFLNRLSDLYKFALQYGLDGFVFEEKMFLKGSPH